MKHKKSVLIVVLLLVLGLTELHAQEAFPATGGNASGSGGSVSYTIGQVFYITNTGITVSMSQGVQQPYEISEVTRIEETKEINLIIWVSPNPTTDFLQLKVDASTTFSIQSLSYQLFDIRGILLENKKLNDSETMIDMNNFVPATYFLKVIEKNRVFKNFKIIKN